MSAPLRKKRDILLPAESDSLLAHTDRAGTHSGSRGSRRRRSRSVRSRVLALGVQIIDGAHDVWADGWSVMVFTAVHVEGVSGDGAGHR